MIRLPCRVRGASALGATAPGQPGPFGPYGGDQDDEPYPDTARPREYEPPAAAVAEPGEVDQ
ncbi:hypothetical protein ACFPH6_19580 [Streptomyces xiangluensis]|uniref:Uncharacterized protein n=1 Tax=Streptomyces xiangluensis TaxID=2665720 RepID=A0ABV8YN47_9ACTN